MNASFMARKSSNKGSLDYCAVLFVFDSAGFVVQ